MRLRQVRLVTATVEELGALPGWQVTATAVGVRLVAERCWLKSGSGACGEFRYHVLSNCKKSTRVRGPLLE